MGYEVVDERVRMIVTRFINSNLTMRQLSEELNLPYATVRNDLRRINKIVRAFGDDAPEVLNALKRRLEENKEKGLSLGGTNSTFNNVTIRDDKGRFTERYKISK